MKVPDAEKWQKEADKLRQIALHCDLAEELKWGKPCLTFRKENVAIVIRLKESCAFSFFKGALGAGPPFAALAGHSHNCGCPTLRGFRKVEGKKRDLTPVRGL
jgi:hypothetical protein